MVTLFCAVVGAGRVFAVDIDLRKTVDELKCKIKETAPGLVCFDADLLKLYLARDGDTWLSSRDADMKALKAKEMPERIQSLMQEHLLLDETSTLHDDAYFGQNFEPGEREIHVLVECPDEPDEGNKYRRECDGSLMEDWFSWHLPGWSSLQSFFTVEKEKRA